MKVLIDEDLPERLRLLIHNHEVVTVRYAGWKGLKNGMLLRTAEAAGFQVFVTSDQNLTDQQNVQSLTMGVVVLSAQKIGELLPHMNEINDAINRSQPGVAVLIDCSSPRANR